MMPSQKQVSGPHTVSKRLQGNLNYPFIPIVIIPLSLLAPTRPGDNRWGEELPVVRVMYGPPRIIYVCPQDLHFQNTR